MHIECRLVAPCLDQKDAVRIVLRQQHVELLAAVLGPVLVGNFRETFATYIRNGETLVCVQALTDERVELAVDTLKQYAPLDVKVVPSAEASDA